MHSTQVLNGKTFRVVEADPVGSSRRTTRDDFNAASVNTAVWDVVAGSGMTVSQSTGMLRVDTGTAVNSVTTLTTAAAFALPARLSFTAQLSQRIANQKATVMLVAVNPTTGAVDMADYASVVLDGAAAGSTNATGTHAGQGGTASTITSTAISGHDWVAAPVGFSIDIDNEQLSVHAVNAVNGNLTAVLAQRVENIPDPGRLYKLQIRVENLGTAPASTTQARFGFVNVMEYSETMTEITGQRARDSLSGVTVTGSVAVSGNLLGITNPVPIGVGSSYTTAVRLNSTASTNATLVVAAASTIQEMDIANTGATWAYVKFANLATVAVPGTTTPTRTFAIPPNSHRTFSFPSGWRFSTGITFWTTGGFADADVAAVAAGQIVMGFTRA